MPSPHSGRSPGSGVLCAAVHRTCLTSQLWTIHIVHGPLRCYSNVPAITVSSEFPPANLRSIAHRLWCVMLCVRLFQKPHWRLQPWLIFSPTAILPRIQLVVRWVTRVMDRAQPGSRRAESEFLMLQYCYQSFRNQNSMSDGCFSDTKPNPLFSQLIVAKIWSAINQSPILHMFIQELLQRFILRTRNPAFQQPWIRDSAFQQPWTMTIVVEPLMVIFRWDFSHGHSVPRDIPRIISIVHHIWKRSNCRI